MIYFTTANGWQTKSIVLRCHFGCYACIMDVRVCLLLFLYFIACGFITGVWCVQNDTRLKWICIRVCICESCVVHSETLEFINFFFSIFQSTPAPLVSSKWNLHHYALAIEICEYMCQCVRCCVRYLLKCIAVFQRWHHWLHDESILLRLYSKQPHCGVIVLWVCRIVQD